VYLSCLVGAAEGAGVVLLALVGVIVGAGEAVPLGASVGAGDTVVFVAFPAEVGAGEGTTVPFPAVEFDVVGAGEIVVSLVVVVERVKEGPAVATCPVNTTDNTNKNRAHFPPDRRPLFWVVLLAMTTFSIPFIFDSDPWFLPL
jgi:hypothetical protein